MINSHALLPTELWPEKFKESMATSYPHRGGNPQLLSGVLGSLTAVFGMDTGVSPRAISPITSVIAHHDLVAFETTLRLPFKICRLGLYP